MDLLAGYTVVSFNHFLVGPTGAQILGDLGADVIAVEPPEGAFQRNWAVNNTYVDGQSVNFLSVSRNKRSLALDLKAPEGRVIAQKLVARADVVMENFRPGTMEKLGLGYEDASRLNPRVIYASATGWGPTGPYRDRPGQDLLVQAASGLAARTGNADGPPTPAGPTVIDHHAAACYALGIVAALLGRERTGKGRRVDVNLLSAALDLQFESLTCYLNGGRSPTARGQGNLSAWFSPAPNGIYQTADGYIAVSMSPVRVLAKAMEVPELEAITDAESFDRRVEIAERVAEALKRKPTAHWTAALAAHKIWFAVVQDYDEVIADPQVAHNGSIRRLAGATGAPIGLVMHPVAYDGEVPAVRLVPQPLGAQTREILGELGYAAAEVTRLEKAGVVRCAEAAPAR